MLMNQLLPAWIINVCLVKLYNFAEVYDFFYVHIELVEHAVVILLLWRLFVNYFRNK
jgi:hypothetical protein